MGKPDFTDGGDSLTVWADSLSPGRFPLQWVWTKDGPKIDPRSREEYMADVRERWRNEDINDMYDLMERYTDEAKEWLSDR